QDRDQSGLQEVGAANEPGAFGERARCLVEPPPDIRRACPRRVRAGRQPPKGEEANRRAEAIKRYLQLLRALRIAAALHRLDVAQEVVEVPGKDLPGGSGWWQVRPWSRR